MPEFSFEKVNYSVRPNKAVERRLILDLLSALSKREGFGLQDCRYLGFGSIWFVDFVLMHRMLGITDMLSIEAVRSREARVTFNRPFDCVKLQMGTYAENFESLTWDRRQIVWLDYDSILKEEMFNDLRRTISVVPSKSFVVVSVNADAIQLPPGSTSAESQESYLREIVGTENLPVDARSRLSRNHFPALVGEIWKNAFQNGIAVRPGFSFVPLVDIQYADGVPMTTYGGLILDEAGANAFVASPGESGCRNGSSQLHLSVPQLTAREKLRFDQLVPPATGTKTKQVLKKLGFELKDTEVESYIRYYLHYPLYGEYQF